MGVLLSVLFIAVVVTCGMMSMKHGYDRLTNRVKTSPKIREVRTAPATVETPVNDNRYPELNIFIKALSNEGYYGRVKLDDRDITLVDDEILAKMATRLANKYDLEWIIPDYRLRLRRVPEWAPRAFREKYNWMIMTPTHAVGFVWEKSDENDLTDR